MEKSELNNALEDMLVVSVAHVPGHPIRWVELRDWSPKHRNLRCEKYEICLSKVAKSCWGGFSCSRCLRNANVEGK